MSEREGHEWRASSERAACGRQEIRTRQSCQNRSQAERVGPKKIPTKAWCYECEDACDMWGLASEGWASGRHPASCRASKSRGRASWQVRRREGARGQKNEICEWLPLARERDRSLVKITLKKSKCCCIFSCSIINCFSGIAGKYGIFPHFRGIFPYFHGIFQHYRRIFQYFLWIFPCFLWGFPLFRRIFRNDSFYVP